MSYIDLHLHSNYSDGVQTPEELVRMAKDLDMAAIALCDHDTVAGVAEAFDAGRRYGLEVLSGVELSTVYGDYEDLHLLGYGFDPGFPELHAALHDFQGHRQERSRKMTRRINECLREEGRELLDPQRVDDMARGAVGRPHLARLLVEMGHARNVEDAFHRYLIPCNEPKPYFPASEAIALVRRAGGIVVMAHPLLVSRDVDLLKELFVELGRLGLAGIEAYATSAFPEEIEQLIGIARSLGLIVTGGSDFHGMTEKNVTIGAGKGQLRIPYTCVEEIRALLAGKTAGWSGNLP
ncbi:MAG: PHP domain-containing protein [Deltaproteobacteria bacterium]|nr:PHP domain-containing protein [Deltaproteobacteria bacterium]